MAFGNSPIGYGIQALANVLSGTGQGAEHADALGQRWRALDLTQRAQDLANPDVTTLYKAMGMPVPEGAGGQVPAAIGHDIVKTSLAQQQQAQQQQRAGAFADQLEKRQTPVDPSTLGMAAPGATGGFSQADPRAALLAGIIRAQGSVSPADVAHLTDVLGMKAEAPHMVPPGSPGFVQGNKFTPLPQEPEPQPPAYDPQKQKLTTTVDNRGKKSYSLSDITESKSVYTRQDIEKQLELERLQPGTLQYQQRYNDLARQIPIGAGGAIAGAGTGLQPSVQSTGGGPPVLAQRPAQPAGTDVKDAGDRNNIIQQLEGTANLVRSMPQLQTAMGRGSLALRGTIQSRTPFETLSPQEQAYTVTHENLRQMLIQAQMGLGPFRSPEMQAQLQNTIGRYWTPGTAERLDALAQLLRGQQSSIGAAEAQGNRIPVHTPPPAPNAIPNSPQTKGDPLGIRR